MGEGAVIQEHSSCKNREANQRGDGLHGFRHGTHGPTVLWHCWAIKVAEGDLARPAKMGLYCAAASYRIASAPARGRLGEPEPPRDRGGGRGQPIIPPR